MGVGHDDQAPLRRNARRNVTPFIKRVVEIIDGQCEWIAKHRGGLAEGYFMLGEVRTGFLGIPLELHVSV